MISIENCQVVGIEPAIRGMRNPMNSWNKSDSIFSTDYTDVGDADLDLMARLSFAGTDHRKYMRMIAVYIDITAPLYWWKEFDTYKVGTVANSCSTMHKIHEKEFTLDDFSTENLIEQVEDKPDHAEILISEDYSLYKLSAVEIVGITIQALNWYRNKYLESKDKKYWWQMIQLLPSSYNQKRTVMMNYEVLSNIYLSRKHHKLDEWRNFCEWIQSLPYSKIITKGE